MPYTIASVESRELNSRYLQGEVSYKTWRDASEQLMFSSRVRVPVGPTLGDGLSRERMNDKLLRGAGGAESVFGAGEMILGGGLIETPFMPLGLVIFAHGSDHVHAGIGTLVGGIDQQSYLAYGASQSLQGIGVNENNADRLVLVSHFLAIDIGMKKATRDNGN